MADIAKIFSPLPEFDDIHRAPTARERKRVGLVIESGTIGVVGTCVLVAKSAIRSWTEIGV